MGMSGAQNVGAGVVFIKADDTQFRKSLNDLPAVAQQKIDVAMKAIQDRIAKASFALVFETDPKKIRALTAEIEFLEQKLNATKLAAIEAGKAEVDASARAAEAIKKKADIAAKAAQKQTDAAKRATAEAAAAASQSVQGSGVIIPIKADPKAFQAAIKGLPAMAAHDIDQAMRGIQDRMNANRVKFAGASSIGNTVEMSRLDAAYDRLGNKLNDVQLKAIQMGQGVKAGSGAAGRALFQVGAAVDDLQYGFRGVMNNIPMIAMAFGMAGLAGGISIAVTLIYQLFTNWELLMGAMKNTNPIMSQSEVTDRLAESIKNARDELEKFEIERMKERTERIGKTGKETLDAPEEIEKKRQDRLEKGLKQLGGEHARKGIGVAMKDDIAGDQFVMARKLDYDRRAKQLASLKNLAVNSNDPKVARAAKDGIPEMEAKLQNAFNNMKQAEREAIDRIVGRALVGDKEARKKLESTIKANPKEFGPHAAQAIGTLEDDKLIMSDKEKEKHKRLLAESKKQDAKFLADEVKDEDRQAEAMSKGMLRRKLLQDPQADPEALVRQQLQAQNVEAGTIDRQAANIAGKLMEKIEEDIKNYQAMEGVGEEAARQHFIDEKTPQEKKQEVARKAQAAKDKTVADAAAQTLTRKSTDKVHQKLLGNIRANVANDAVAHLLARYPEMSLEEAVRLAPMVAKAAKAEVSKQVAAKQATMKAGTTFGEAAIALQNEERRKLGKIADDRAAQKEEMNERVEDAKERVHDAHEKVKKIFKGENKPQFMGGMEHIKAIQLGALNQEDRQKALTEALKDETAATRELRDALRNRKNFLVAGPPDD